jgi:hypothetical protein
METWTDIDFYIRKNRLPYSVIRFEDRTGLMIDYQTGQAVANRVESADKFLKEQAVTGA